MANATGMAPSGRLKLVTSGRILDAAVRSRVSYLRWRPKRVWASSGSGNYAAAAFFAAVFLLHRLAVQLLGQPGCEPGVDLPAGDRVEDAGLAWRRPTTGDHGPYGIHQLYFGKLTMHADFLRARIRLVLQGEPGAGGPGDGSGMDGGAGILPVVDAALLFRAAGVGLAFTNLPGNRAVRPVFRSATLPAPGPPQVIPIPDDDRGRHQHKQARRDQKPGTRADALPFVQRNSPERAEDNDAGHVQRPTGKLEGAHLGFAHGVEEELHVPGGAGEGAEAVVGQHRRTLGFCRGNRGQGSVSAHLRAEVLIAGAVADVQDQAPDEVGGEASYKNHH